MSSLDSLHRRIDKMLAQERQLLPRPAAIECITVRLPIKDDEPPVGYQHGKIYFYVPESRWEEELLYREQP